MSTCSCLTLILDCIIYWQAREIARVTGSGSHDTAGFDLDFSLLAHVSPIEWVNVVLYGEYVVDRNLISGSGPTGSPDRRSLFYLDSPVRPPHRYALGAPTKETKLV